MKNYGVTLWDLHDLLDHLGRTAVNIEGRWAPLRPSGRFDIVYRIKAAWAVFTGRADAVVWPEGQ